MSDSDPDWRLVTLLSASSYPAPAPSGVAVSEAERLNSREVSYGGYEFKHLPSASTNDAVVPPDRHISQQPQTAKKSGKAGRPLLPDDEDEAKSAKERRQIQLRRAQRAYRQRKESSMSALQGQTARLQNTINQMRDNVSSINDTLNDSGLLAEDTDLANQLRAMTQKCLDLAKDTGYNDTPRPSDLSSQQTVTSPSTESLANEVVVIDTQRRAKGPKYYPSRALSSPPMSYSLFIKQLELVTLQQAYLALSNPEIQSRKLRRTFVFLWTLMDRECMAVYVEAALNAALAEKRIEYSDDVPFFKLGDAGSHYPVKTPTPSNRLYSHRNEGQNIVSDPLSMLPLDMQDQFDGAWFDIVDLEGYLEQNQIQLHVTPPTDSDRASAGSMYVNVTRFITALLKQAVCLGRSPGFQIREVQKALSAAAWT